MQISIREEQGVCVLQTAGDLDAAKAPELGQVLDKAINDGKKKIVVDLGDTRFVDSSGLAALVRGFKRARAASGNLALAHLQPAVLKVFELTRLDKAFDIFPDANEAVRKFAH